MRLRIDHSSTVPPYEQLRLQLAGRINDGTLAVGSKLPTVRALAIDLGIAANTVARAYRELEVAELLETRGRAGTFVGSNGDSSAAGAAAAAVEYVRVTDALGIQRREALAIVTAALGISSASRG
jgi:DNA-binding transcriptional regulator YhcF (GntR family)